MHARTHARTANQLSAIITDIENSYPDSVVLVLGDFIHVSLVFNVLKTKGMVVDFRCKGLVSQPLAINEVEVERVGSFRFLGTIVSSSMKWGDNLSCITKKAHQRLFFLQQLRKFGVACKGMLHFYHATIESILSYSITVWYGNTTVQNRLQLDRIVHTAEKIIGCKLSPLSEIYKAHMQRQGMKILLDIRSCQASL